MVGFGALPCEQQPLRPQVGAGSCWRHGWAHLLGSACPNKPSLFGVTFDAVPTGSHTSPNPAKICAKLNQSILEMALVRFCQRDCLQGTKRSGCGAGSSHLNTSKPPSASAGEGGTGTPVPPGASPTPGGGRGPMGLLAGRPAPAACLRCCLLVSPPNRF